MEIARRSVGGLAGDGAGSMGAGRSLWDASIELRADLSKLREDIPRTYVAREDYRADIREIKDMLGKIFDRLDGKVDK